MGKEMQPDEAVINVLDRAVSYARSNKYEYVTPETVLLALCGDDLFCRAFEACGGNIKQLKKHLEKNIEENTDKIQSGESGFSDGTNNVIAWAAQIAISSGNSKISIRHIVYGIWKQEESYAVYFMKLQDINRMALLGQLTVQEELQKDDDNDDLELEIDEDDDDDDDDDEDEDENYVKVDPKGMYAPCLNEMLDDVNPLIGREEELERTVQILCRKDKNNPLHIGEPGVGKTAITYGLVQRINSGDVPDELKGSRVYMLDLGSILAGTQYRGDFEKRMKNVLGSLEKEEKPILFIDEIHNLSGSGATGESSFDAANILKPYLLKGKIRFIGATTFEEYKKYFEKNKSMVRRFQNVEIKEPSESETLEILKGLRQRYEDFHKVVYSDEALEYAVKMSMKHINERFLPDKAIDLIDEAGAYKKLHPQEGRKSVVDKDIINVVLTKICRVPIETVKTDEVQGLKTLEDRIKKKIFGQDEAVSQVVNAIKFSRAGLLEEDKPLASLLFVGPTGVGKTEIARTLAAEMGVKLIRLT